MLQYFFLPYRLLLSNFRSVLHRANHVPIEHLKTYSPLTRLCEAMSQSGETECRIEPYMGQDLQAHPGRMTGAGDRNHRFALSPCDRAGTLSVTTLRL
jgi:hypothetical protein